jgi:hypothetical protein
MTFHDTGADQRISNLRIENATPYGVVLGLRDFIYTNRLNARFEGQESPVS